MRSHNCHTGIFSLQHYCHCCSTSSRKIFSFFPFWCSWLAFLDLDLSSWLLKLQLMLMQCEQLWVTSDGKRLTNHVCRKTLDRKPWHLSERYHIKNMLLATLFDLWLLLTIVITFHFCITRVILIMQLRSDIGT